MADLKDKVGIVTGAGRGSAKRKSNKWSGLIQTNCLNESRPLSFSA